MQQKLTTLVRSVSLKYVSGLSLPTNLQGKKNLKHLDSTHGKDQE